MIKIERLKAILNGEVFDKTPYAVWRHFPVDDLYADRLAEKQLQYHKKFDSLVMKVSPNGRYCVVDWGCEIAFDDARVSGSAFCTSYRVNTMDDWNTLEKLDVSEGMYGEQLKALELINKGITDGTPFVETVFNPLMVACKLTKSRDLVLQTIKEDPKALKEGLKTITKVTKEFVKTAIENGAVGIFIATQEASHDILTEEQYKEYSMIYDLELFDAIKNKAEFNIMHIHGENVMFDLIANNYPVQALNWHDQLTAPTIAKAYEIFDGILMGGIEEKEILLNATIDEITAQIQQEIYSVKGKRLIISPGCVIPVIIPTEKVEELVNYLRK